MVWKLDRFGRSVLNLLEGLRKLRSWEVRFLAPSQSIDTDGANPTSQLLLHILAAVAEFEREMIRERVKGGMETARLKGKECHRPCAVFDVERAISLSAGGLSIRAIAPLLGVSRSVVARALAVPEGRLKGAVSAQVGVVSEASPSGTA
jgi:DNA invertase Pin-like site-specific DNA recombinase